jgi:hypothetical protein
MRSSVSTNAFSKILSQSSKFLFSPQNFPANSNSRKNQENSGKLKANISKFTKYVLKIQVIL